MNRRHLRRQITVAAAAVALTILAATAQAQILGGKGGLLKGMGSACQKDKGNDCSCMSYVQNDCYGQHACCGCGCAHSGFCNWCGHGKNWGWTLRAGALLPKCVRANAWKHYYAGHGCCGHCGGHGCPHCGGSGNDLFYNYYAPQTGAGGGVATQMYPSPHATPDIVPQTYYTYQPWLPHEHLYHHNRQYTQYQDGGLGRTQTRVSWGASPIIRHYDP